jgi:hypothetical protein
VERKRKRWEMRIKIEPKAFFMYAVFLAFSKEHPHPEDEAIKAYLDAHELILSGQNIEGVSELWICYPVWVSKRNRTTHVRASHDDYASAALPLLPRDRYCQAWSIA